ncbi:hypothetical protein VNI00_015839 [Paramarasmius palmivorus]|uniref:Uncharacterized protein n=1 Tax=Paramarasmius palmivorus TaxID=297713 RepID=A0AAW0BIV7_9AGAR
MTWQLNWSTVYDRDEHLEYWKRVIQWAKSFGTQAPNNFLRRMKSFMCSFHIGSPDASIQSLGHAMAFLEQILYIPKHLHIWCQLLGYDIHFQGTHDLYVLPIDHTSPSSWAILKVTREKGNTITRLLESLSDCSSGRLIEDIRNGTYNSVRHLDQVKYDDLYSLKKLVAQHRERFGLQPTYPCTPPMIHSNSLSGEDVDPAHLKADPRTRDADLTNGAISDVSDHHDSNLEEQPTQKRKASPDPSRSRKRVCRGT